jgi:hypothetical protein
MQSFIKDVLSGTDGKWSFGRVSSAAVLVMAMIAFGFILRHLLQATDPNMIGIWLTNTPIILLSIAGVICSLYGISTAGAALPELMRAAKQAKKDVDG